MYFIYFTKIHYDKIKIQNGITIGKKLKLSCDDIPSGNGPLLSSHAICFNATAFVHVCGQGRESRLIAMLMLQLGASTGKREWSL